MTPEELSLVETKDLVGALFERFDSAVFAGTARIGPQRAQHGYFITGDASSCVGLADWLVRLSRKQIDEGRPGSQLGEDRP